MSTEQKDLEYPIGTIISDDETPSFETVRIKLKAGEDVKPGALIKMVVSRNEKTILIGRVRSGYEVNPSKNVANVAASDVVRMQTPHLSEDRNPSMYRVIEADLIEEVINGESRAPQNLPNSGSNVYLASPQEVVKALGLLSDDSHGLYIGETTGGIQTNITLNRESLQRHLFICGTTGSGKSYAMTVLAEEVIKHKIPIIFIDTQDEYSDFVCKYGGHAFTPVADKNFSVKISSLTESELISLLPEVTQKNPLHCEVVSKAFDKLKADLINSRKEFSLQDIENQLAAAAEALSSKQGDAPRLEDAVKRKLFTLQREQIFGEGIDWKKFMYPCLSINCKSLTSRQLKSLSTAVLRELQDLRKNEEIPPYVMVIDEAHLFVPQGENSACKQIIREGVRIGRHHGICMVLMTQSPVDIDRSTIRQCNTRLVFALEPDQLDAIKGVKSDATEEMLNALPKMPRGTCLLSGTYESVKHTIPVKIRQRHKDCKGGGTPDIFKEMQDKWLK